MGRRGPAPQPTALKVLNGNPGKRALPKDEPKPDPFEPHMPAWLDDDARAEWRRVTPILLKMGLLTVADGAALAVYCEAYSTMGHALRTLQEDGPTFISPKTSVEHARPEVGIVQQCRVAIKTFCQEFGMTPSARSRMIAQSDEREKSGMEGLLQ
jgi:P27 family predicted phage terminase small subunit